MCVRARGRLGDRDEVGPNLNTWGGHETSQAKLEAWRNFFFFFKFSSLLFLKIAPTSGWWQGREFCDRRVGSKLPWHPLVGTGRRRHGKASQPSSQLPRLEARTHF